MQPVGTTLSVQGTIVEAGAGTVGARPQTGSPTPIARAEAGDSAALSAEARTRARAGAWATALDSLQSLLGKFKAAPSSAPATRQEVKEILASVRGAAAGGPIGNVPPPFTVSDIADGVERFRVVGANLKPGESAAVEVTVTQSAQTGALLLSFGGAQLDLVGAGTDDPTARFDIEIKGNIGARELSFASGTTLQQIIDTINTFTDVTGVSTTLAGETGIRVDSTRHGADSFASVRIMEDGGAVGDGAYEYEPTDNNTVNPNNGPIAFVALQNRLLIRGQDVRATINGNDYTGDGLRLRSVGANVDAIILLEQWRAQTLGTFNAATVSAPPPIGPSGGAAPSVGIDVRG